MDKQSNHDHFVPVNDINIHYTEHGTGPALLLLHGLTANASVFDAIVPALAHKYRVICVDLRGNGLSDKPAFGYSVADHAQDIVELIAHLDKEKVYLGGHSFGGYIAFYIAANYPALVSKLLILDAAKAMNPKAVAMLSGAISRLDVTYPDFDTYIEYVKKAPYIDFWDPAMLSYYRADMQDMPDGGVNSRGNLMNITEKSIGLGIIDWPGTIERIEQPTLLVNALDNYTLDEPLLPDDIAKETVAMMKDAHYKGVDGNHLTMLYGNGAKEIAEVVKDFLG